MMPTLSVHLGEVYVFQVSLSTLVWFSIFPLQLLHEDKRTSRATLREDLWKWKVRKHLFQSDPGAEWQEDVWWGRPPRRLQPLSSCKLKEFMHILRYTAYQLLNHRHQHSVLLWQYIITVHDLILWLTQIMHASGTNLNIVLDKLLSSVYIL